MCSANYSETYDVELWKEFLEKVYFHQSLVMNIIIIVFMGLIFITGLAANIICSIVIISDKTMHTATNFYLLNLTISDVLLALFVISEFVLIISSTDIFMGILECKIQMFSMNFMCSTSIFTLAALSIERYVAVCRPLLLKSSAVWKRVLKIIITIWILATVTAIPDVYSVELIISEKWHLCSAKPTKTFKIVNYLIAIILFLLPLIIMVTMYTLIAINVNRNERTIMNRAVFNHENRKMNRGRVNKIAVALTLAFIFCWGPYFCTRLIFFSYKVQDLLDMFTWWKCLWDIAFLSSSCSILINPILCSLMSSKFKKALKRFWLLKIKRQRSLEENSRYTYRMRRKNTNTETSF